MNALNIEERAKKIIAKVFKKSLDDVSPSTLLREDLRAKSMNFMELQALLENEFQIELPMGKVSKAKSVQDIIDIVAEFI